MKKTIVSVAAALVLAGVLPARAVMFSDDFESGSLSKWVGVNGKWSVGSGAAHSGSKSVDVIGYNSMAGDTLTLRVAALHGEKVSLDYWYRIRENLEFDDTLVAEYALGGGAWQPLVYYNSIKAGDWRHESVTLPDFVSKDCNIDFRWRAMFTSFNDEFLVDDVAILPEPTTVLMLVCASVWVCRRRTRC